MDEFIDSVFKFWNDIWFCSRKDDKDNYIDPFNIFPPATIYWYKQNEYYTPKIKDQLKDK